MPEPRTAVMILVEATWEDQSGRVQTARARMENRSAGGACIRLKTRIGVGARLRIQGRWEQFSGVARYCRSEGREYLVGIQRDAAQSAIPKRLVAKEASQREGVRSTEAPVSAARVERLPQRAENKQREIPIEKQKVESVPITSVASAATAMPPREAGQETETRDSPHSAKPQEIGTFRRREQETEQPPTGKEAGKERTYMQRKWFEMVHRGDKRDSVSGNGNGDSNGNGVGEAVNRAPVAAAAVEQRSPEPAEEGDETPQVELLTVEEIYRGAGIMNPRKGYSIGKVIEMLHSEHICGLSKEMRRASVLMALDAAGISVDEVLKDAKVRQDAIDTYEAEQRKQFEAMLAQKAEENVQIQAELERVKARYAERLRRNLDGMAREKATFGNWLTMKQQESQSMMEAVETCLKPPAAEPPDSSIPDVSLVEAKAKPV